MAPSVVAQIVLATLQDILLATAAGTIVCRVLLERSGLGVSRRLSRWQQGTACVLVLACIAYLWLQSAIMSGTPLADAGTAMTAVLTESHFGIAWSIGCVGAVLLALGSFSGRRGLPFAAAGVLVYAAGKAAASHAADGGDFTLREAVHVVHLVATAAWAGGVIVSAAVLGRRASTASGTSSRWATFCTRLSQLATAALVVVIASGVYNAVQDTRDATVPLLDSAYGRLLAEKLVLVALAVLLGGWNRMVFLPQLRTGPSGNGLVSPVAQRRFGQLLTVEALAMIAILAVAGVLGHTAPPDS